MSNAPRQLVKKVDLDRLPEESQVHPLNPRSQICGHSLSDLVGLSRIALHRVRIPPGKESFVYHLHYFEEEFLYVLAGRGLIEIGEQQHEIGPGDFVGFATPSVGHHLRNPFEEDLVYLTGGERRQVEIADFPRLGKRLVRMGADAKIYPLDAGKSLGEA